MRAKILHQLRILHAIDDWQVLYNTKMALPLVRLISSDVCQ